MNSIQEAEVRLFVSPRGWIVPEAVRQLYATSELEGVRLTVGFPDLHPGSTTPVGAAFVTEDVIYPHLIGSDIGCGLALFQTDLLRREAKVERWSELRFNLEHPWDEFVSRFLEEQELESTAFDSELGTLGGGNHFAELLTMETVKDPTGLKQFGLGKQQLVLLVHSGSRDLGESILDRYTKEQFDQGAETESFAAREYLREHDFALRWAKANRQLIARRFADAIGAEDQRLWDGCHNSITKQEHEGELLWVHRRAALTTNDGFVVIPGSRGSLSYLVKVVSNSETHAWSLAHGAGRKWSRSESRLRMRERFGARQLVQTGMGNRVICEDRDLLYEEAPAAYKDIETVIDDLVDADLISVVATFRPLLTYKTRKLQR